MSAFYLVYSQSLKVHKSAQDGVDEMRIRAELFT